MSGGASGARVSSAWRFLESQPTGGARNMGIDEALLEACLDRGDGFPCLRLYAFSPPCLSLGFSQPIERSADLEACRRQGIDVVRRPTGGRAVLHDVEVTYAVVARTDAPPFDGGVLDSYREISRGLMAGFSRLGLRTAIGQGDRAPQVRAAAEVCFAEPTGHEIACGAYKVTGSAQARRRGALLQHGSIPLRLDVDRIAAASGVAPASLPPMKGLEQILGVALDREAIHRAVREGFEEAFGVPVVAGEITPAEHERAEWLRAWRYLGEAWTFRR